MNRTFGIFRLFTDGPALVCLIKVPEDWPMSIEESGVIVDISSRILAEWGKQYLYAEYVLTNGSGATNGSGVKVRRPVKDLTNLQINNLVAAYQVRNLTANTCHLR